MRMKSRFKSRQKVSVVGTAAFRSGIKKMNSISQETDKKRKLEEKVSKTKHRLHAK